MHGTFKQNGPAESGTPIGGTFYPGEGSGGGKSIVAVLPKLLFVLVAMAVLRKVAGSHHGGSSMRSRRREAIAQFHRELHAEDDAQSAGSTDSAAKGVKA
jgi:hypothetical protein